MVHFTIVQCSLLGLTRNLLAIPTACTKLDFILIVEYIKCPTTKGYGMLLRKFLLLLNGGILICTQFKICYQSAITNLEFFMLSFYSILSMYCSCDSHNFLLFFFSLEIISFPRCTVLHLSPSYQRNYTTFSLNYQILKDVF